MKLTKVILTLAILVASTAASAKVHTWIPNRTAHATGGTQTIVIIGTHIQWGAGATQTGQASCGLSTQHTPTRQTG